MAALSITAEDRANADAAALEIESIMRDGAVVGVTQVIDPIPDFKTPSPDALKAFFKSAAAGILRRTTVVGPNATISVVSGTPQIGVAGSAFANPLVVVVRDAYNNPVPGATVTFSAPGGGSSASLSSPTLTDSNGQTQVTATANSVTGVYSVVATVAGIFTTVSFVLTNIDTKIVFAAAKAEKIIQQTITGGNAYNTIDFNLIAKDTISAITTGGAWVYKVPTNRAGLYRVSTLIALTSPTSGDQAEISLWRVGNDIFSTETLEVILNASRTPSANGAAGTYLSGEATIELADGEGIRIKVRTSNGSSQILLATTGTNWVRIFRESDIPT